MPPTRLPFPPHGLPEGTSAAQSDPHPRALLLDVNLVLYGAIAQRRGLRADRLLRMQHRIQSHLKRSLANLAKRNLAQLTALVKTRLGRMQYRPALLEGFLARTGLDLTPFCNPRN